MERRRGGGNVGSPLIRRSRRSKSGTSKTIGEYEAQPVMEQTLASAPSSLVASYSFRLNQAKVVQHFGDMLSVHSASALIGWPIRIRVVGFSWLPIRLASS